MKPIPFWRLAAQILELYRADQDMRRRALRPRGRWNHRIDLRTSQFIKNLLPYMGWPSRSQIGVNASRSLALLIRHVDHDVALQERCLDLMQVLSRESPGEVHLSDLAHLVDRICVNRRQPQVYGTQFDEIDGKFVPRPIADRAHVNRRRRRMGLGTLKQATADMYRRYGVPDVR